MKEEKKGKTGRKQEKVECERRERERLKKTEIKEKKKT